MRTKLMTFAAALVLLLAGFAAGTAVVSTLAQTQPTPQTVSLTVNQAAVPLNEIEKVYADVYASVSPSVVAINVVGNFESGSGSGFVIDSDGHIMTNYHVVRGGEQISVNFLDGTIARAELVGIDPASDLAVIQVDLPADRLQPIVFGNSSELVIGQQVLAIGSPFGQRWTMTSGIVSALERSIDALDTQFSTGGVIQTDASINPGNSGGPLLNLRGELVGINAQILSEERANSGVGFAIPSNLAARVAEELVATGFVDYAYMGISGRSIELIDMEALELPNNTRGVFVSDVLPGTPADEGGLQNPLVIENPNGSFSLESADIITAIDGTELSGMSALIGYLSANNRPGDVVTLDVLRGGEKLSLAVTLGERPGSS